MKRKVKINEQEVEFELLSKTADTVSFELEGKKFTYKLSKNSDGKLVLIDQDGKSQIIYSNGTNIIDTFTAQYQIEKISLNAQVQQTESQNTFISPLPGKVVKITAAKGTKVKSGDEILRIEAMKMEHRICAQADGLIKVLNVKEGDTVSDGEVLGEID